LFLFFITNITFYTSSRTLISSKPGCWGEREKKQIIHLFTGKSFFCVILSWRGKALVFGDDKDVDLADQLVEKQGVVGYKRDKP
jgi:hypothetical protein